MESDLKRLVIHEFIHFIFAVPFALFLWKKTKSKSQIVVLFLATFFVDLDHFVDYFAYSGFKLSILGFLSGEYFVTTHKSFTPFHAWEWLVVVGVIAKLRGWKSIFTALLFGLSPHFIVDSLVTGEFLFYSLIFRVSRGFYFPD